MQSTTHSHAAAGFRCPTNLQPLHDRISKLSSLYIPLFAVFLAGTVCHHSQKQPHRTLLSSKALVRAQAQIPSALQMSIGQIEGLDPASEDCDKQTFAPHSQAPLNCENDASIQAHACRFRAPFSHTLSDGVTDIRLPEAMINLRNACPRIPMVNSPMLKTEQ